MSYRFNYQQSVPLNNARMNQWYQWQPNYQPMQYHQYKTKTSHNQKKYYNPQLTPTQKTIKHIKNGDNVPHYINHNNNMNASSQISQQMRTQSSDTIYYDTLSVAGKSCSAKSRISQPQNYSNPISFSLLLITGYTRKSILLLDIIDLFIKYYGYQIKLIICPKSKYFNGFNVLNYSNITKKSQTIHYKPISNQSVSEEVICTARNIEISSNIIDAYNNKYNRYANYNRFIDKYCYYNMLFLREKYRGKQEFEYRAIIFNNSISFKFYIPSINSAGPRYKKSIYSQKYGLLMMDGDGIYSFKIHNNNEWKWSILNRNKMKMRNRNKIPFNMVYKSELSILDNESSLFLTQPENNRCCYLINLNNLNVFYTQSSLNKIGYSPIMCNDDVLNKRIYVYSQMKKYGQYYDILNENWGYLPKLKHKHMKSNTTIWCDDINQNILYLLSSYQSSTYIKMLDLRTNRWNTCTNHLPEINENNDNKHYKL